MAAADASPGVMTSRQYTEQHVADKIKEWVAQETNGDIKTKFYEDAVNHIESILRRPISCLETTWIERQYVKIVLEMWLSASFEKAFADLEDQSSNFNTEISQLLHQLKLINSFEDVKANSSKLSAESKLREWCDCRYLQLILGQTSLFKNTPRFAILVPSYFQHFKTSLTDQILSRCQKGLIQDQINFISALNDFFADAINRDHTQVSLEDNSLVIKFEKIWLEKMVNSFKINNEDSEETKKACGLRDRFKLMNASLSEDSWTPQLKLLIKETCETFLLPKTVIAVDEVDGKEIISIKGVAVFVSKILQEMIDLKIQNSNVKEIQIVGLVSVHVDCDLESKDWHGMNVGIVTDKLYVDKEVHWDVSGQHGNDQPEGKPDVQPGESGGNIHVICQEMINAEKWTIVSDGGDGSDGQNGAFRKIGPDGKETFHRKWSKEEFQKAFPTMSTFDDSANEKAMETVVATLKEILPVNKRNNGKDVLPGYRKDFYISGTTKEDREIRVIYRKGKKTRHTLIYSEGCNNVEQGGYGGSITIEYLRSEEAENKMPLGVPLVGKGAQQLPAERMDVYEASGSVGRTGKPVGDVGFIHSVKKNDENNGGEGIFIGFDNDIRLEYEVTDDKTKFKKDNIPYAKFMKPYSDSYYCNKMKKYYGSILLWGHDDTPMTIRNISRWINKAVKMKAIIRQNLVQHLTEIDERKQMAQSLKATATSDSMGQQSNYIEKLIGQIDQKQAQLHRLSRQRNQQREEFRQCYVKPSTRTTKVPNSLSSFTTPVKRNGRRPVDFQIDLPKITCFDLLPTADGNDSALHSMLGRMNSVGVYVCADTDKFRQQIADFFQNKENVVNKIKAVKNFVLRQNYGKAFPFASAKKKEFLTCRQQNGDESQFDWLQPPQLSEEYVSFIQVPMGELDLTEVRFLAKVLNITIYVYEDQHNSSSLKYKTTFNPNFFIQNQHFILYKGYGKWQRLEANENLQQLCNDLPITDLLQSVQQQTNSFSTLIELLTKWNHHDLIASIEMLNPEDGVTPDKLSQLLLEKHFNKLLTALPENEQQNDEATGKQLDDLASDIRLLTERVLEYNQRDLSPIFYLYVVSKCTDPKDWKYEFLLLEMEERLTELPDNRDVWKEEILTSLKNLDDQTVALIRNSLIMATDFGDFLFSTMERILKMLPVKSGSNEIDSEYVDQLPVELLSQLPLNDWLYELRSKIWEIKVNQLTAGDISRHGELETLMKEAVYLLLELEYQKGEEFCESTFADITDLPELVDKLRETLYPCTNSTERDCEMIMSIIEKERKRKCDTEEKIKSEMNSLGWIKSEVKESKSIQPQTGKNLKKLIEKLAEKLRTKLKAPIKSYIFKEDEGSEFLCEYLPVYDSVVRLVMGFPLRDTQRVAIMFLLDSRFCRYGRILVQVSTGEGKSLIVAGVAIFCAISGLKVDIVTSNDVLALRDSTLSVADGGLRDLYEYFKVGVANNCSQSLDDRAKAYNSAVVYGELANFQRDYLMQTFYGLNVLGDRQMDCVIVDEVDCMLLDRGSNTLYLSHDVPGMEMLESLYVFIWERIQSSVQLDVIKSQVLYDLYGAITKRDLETIHAPLKDKPSEQNKLWHYLIQARIIHPYGRLLIKNVEANKPENKIDYKENPALNPKLIFFFRKVIERERHIRIPEHLLPFVDRHLDTWLANALRALELKRDEDYVIDQDRTDTSPDLNPQVIIIDPDTGTDQTTSQWDGALHQFLQLKEGCKLTLQSLKAVFISNEVYIKKYKRIAGVSGTLGSLKERDYMMKSYECDHVSIPTALPKRFNFKTPKMLKTKESWLSSIINEIRETVTPAKTYETRSIVIFCQTIKDVNIVNNNLKMNLPQLIANKKVHRYTRDYEQFAFEAKQLDIGHVIIATNLAGRGTDIKISDELSKNGGLHICLTYLPLNERITEQAMGRSGRKGAPGSGILILCQESGVASQNDEECWSVSKYFSMKHERHQQELQRITRLQEDSKKNQSHTWNLKSFITKYTDLKNRMKEKGKWEYVEIKIFCDNALDQWALWLDEIDHNSVKSFGVYQEKYLESSLIDKIQLPESPSDINWIPPARSVVLATYLAQKKFEKNFISTAVEPVITGKNEKAEARKISASLLEKLVLSNDAFFYPVAPYYLAFLSIKEKGEGEKKQTDITKMLRSSETILNEHIRMQMSFYNKINQKLDQRHSFCATDAYKQQKINIANLLGHYIYSIRSLLGSHYCSAFDLEKAGIDGQKVNKLFDQLKIDCIIQPKLNDDKTVPNKKAAIQHVALIHNVDDPASLEENLTSAFKKVNLLMLNEKEIDKEIKTKIKITCTRKSFWKTLVNKQVLKDAIDFVIMDDSECDIEPKLDRNEELTIDFTSKDNVFFRAMPYAVVEVIQQNKIVFPKQYVKDIIKKNNHLEYYRRKKTFELNKMGRLNFIQLKEINEKKRNKVQLKEDDLPGIFIVKAERKGILTELENQKIIDRQGYLAQEYNGQEFCYPQCPVYEGAVMRLLGRKFAKEIVIRQWLKSEEDPELLKAIELLPLNPHQNLLADLMAAHVIEGARVKDDKTFIDLKQAIEKICDDKEERECLLNYLRSRQALYVLTKSPDDFSLDNIYREIRTMKGMENVSDELYIFGLVGFDQHIIYENKWSKKAISQASISIVGGFGLMIGGYFLDKALWDVPSMFGVNFLVTGGTALFFNGFETLLLRNKSTRTDYGRQSLRNVVGNPAPFEKMSTIWKLFKSKKSINQTPSHPSSFTVQEQNLTENQLVKVVATAGNILHDNYRLFGSHLVEKINKTVDISMAQMKKTLSKVWQSHNHEDIECLVKEKMEKLKTDWFEKVKMWFSEVKQIVLREATMEPYQLMPIVIKHLENFALKIKMVHVTVECLKQFQADLEEDFSKMQEPLPLTLTIDHFDVEMGERFYKKVVENMKSELARKAEQIMELFQTEFASSTTEQEEAEEN